MAKQDLKELGFNSAPQSRSSSTPNQQQQQQQQQQKRETTGFIAGIDKLQR